jgi:hypothetical protein
MPLKTGYLLMFRTTAVQQPAFLAVRSGVAIAFGKKPNRTWPIFTADDVVP